MTATQHYFNRIAIIFDFDETLVPESYRAFIDSLGYDVQEFREQYYLPLLEQGWEKIPAKFYSLIQASQERKSTITQTTLTEFGAQLTPFPGVIELFATLKGVAQSIKPDIEVEFYLVSSGILDIARSSPIASYFKAMWGCEFHFNAAGEVAFLKRSVTYAEKPRYLNYLSRGIYGHHPDDILFAYQDISDSQLHVPFNQMIYVGDGTSDLPCFRLMQDRGGIAIGVYPSGTVATWKNNTSVSKSQRVVNLAQANYQEGSEGLNSLKFAVASLANRVALLELGQEE